MPALKPTGLLQNRHNSLFQHVNKKLDFLNVLTILVRILRNPWSLPVPLTQPQKKKGENGITSIFLFHIWGETVRKPCPPNTLWQSCHFSTLMNFCGFLGAEEMRTITNDDRKLRIQSNSHYVEGPCSDNILGGCFTHRERCWRASCPTLTAVGIPQYLLATSMKYCLSIKIFIQKRELTDAVQIQIQLK